MLNPRPLPLIGFALCLGDLLGSTAVGGAAVFGVLLTIEIACQYGFHANYPRLQNCPLTP